MSEMYVIVIDTDLPATKERLDYFVNCLRIKITQYQHFAEAPVPKELIYIPLALSYETYITLYWPGAFKCCNKLFSAGTHITYCKLF